MISIESTVSTLNQQENKYSSQSSGDACRTCKRSYDNTTISGPGVTILGDVVKNVQIYRVVEQAVTQALHRDLGSIDRRHKIAGISNSITHSLLDLADSLNRKESTSQTPKGSSAALPTTYYPSTQEQRSTTITDSSKSASTKSRSLNSGFEYGKLVSWPVSSCSDLETSGTTFQFTLPTNGDGTIPIFRSDTKRCQLLVMAGLSNVTHPASDSLSLKLNGFLKQKMHAPDCDIRVQPSHISFGSVLEWVFKPTHLLLSTKHLDQARKSFIDRDLDLFVAFVREGGTLILTPHDYGPHSYFYGPTQAEYRSKQIGFQLLIQEKLQLPWAYVDKFLSPYGSQPTKQSRKLFCYNYKSSVKLNGNLYYKNCYTDNMSLVLNARHQDMLYVENPWATGTPSQPNGSSPFVLTQFGKGYVGFCGGNLGDGVTDDILCAMLGPKQPRYETAPSVTNSAPPLTELNGYSHNMV